MPSSDLTELSATDLRAMLLAGKISSTELTRAVLEKGERLDPILNVFATFLPERALDAAAAADVRLAEGSGGLLEGIPVTLKDLVFLEGAPVKAGSHIFKDRVAVESAPVADRIVGEGGVVFAKTTVPEIAWSGLGHSPLTGITRNPWNPAMTSGGSSAGAGACAAAGIGPLHSGSDGAGSVRIPASFCGVYGLKPTFGLIPNYPAPNNDNVSHIGPLTRTVSDAALLLSTMAGPDKRDPSSLLLPRQLFHEQLDVDLKGWRIAYSPDLGYLSVDSDVAAKVAKAVEVFQSMGCAVEELRPGLPDCREMQSVFYRGNFSGIIGDQLSSYRNKMDPALVACIDEAEGVSATQYVIARGQRLALVKEINLIFDRYDLLLTPSLSVPAFEAGRIIPSHWEQHEWDWLRWAGFLYPFNLSGSPAASCPCGLTESGLPVGLQIVGPRYADLRVLQASRAFEKAAPWPLLAPTLQ